MRYPLESRKGIATVDAASAELFCTSEDHFKLKVDDSERGRILRIVLSRLDMTVDANAFRKKGN
jgi:hypothetical protein